MTQPKDKDGRVPEVMRPARMDALATLPVFMKLNGKRAVLAGGTEAAAWKAELLSAAGAELEVFSEDVSEELAEVAHQPPAGSIRIIQRRWQPGDLQGAAIAIGAITDDAEAGAFVAAAKAAGVPVNVIDRPEFCEFQFGAIVNRSPLIVSISTDGGAPVFGQAIRSRLEALLPAGFKRWAEAAKVWRKEGERLGADMSARRRFWNLFAERALANAEKVPDASDLEELINEASRERQSVTHGFVSLVGAGPGDPELLTLKAVRALRAADAVLYDDLVEAPVLEFARRESKRMLVGKTGYGPACKQTEINALMVRLALEGKRVVRLKSGDPMIFGRGGEEMDELEAAGIPFEVIPGISAAQAAAARLKVSLTHRDHAKRLQFVTGHSREGRLPQNLDWQALADPRATTAVYMALRTLPELAARLVAAGLPATTPAAAIFNVTRGAERIVRASIAGLAVAIESEGASGPCLVVIGKVLQQPEAGSTAEHAGARQNQ